MNFLSLTDRHSLFYAHSNERKIACHGNGKLITLYSVVRTSCIIKMIFSYDVYTVHMYLCVGVCNNIFHISSKMFHFLY